MASSSSCGDSKYFIAGVTNILVCTTGDLGFPGGSDSKIRSLGREDSLEKGMATHSIILA